MRKTVLRSSLLLTSGLLLIAGTATAGLVPWSATEVGEKNVNGFDSVNLESGYSWTATDYWTLSDFSSSVSGDMLTIIRQEQAGYESSFGFYTVDDLNNPTAVINTFTVFEKDADPWDTAKVIFEKAADGSVSIGLDGDNDVNGEQNFSDFSDKFGFFYHVDAGNDGDFDYTWYSDKQFNQYYGGAAVDTSIEHVITAYNPAGTKPGGTAMVYLDDQISTNPADFDYTDMTVMVDDVAPVPEPATMMLFGAGLAGLAGLGRRRKK